MYLQFLGWWSDRLEHRIPPWWVGTHINRTYQTESTTTNLIVRTYMRTALISLLPC